MRIVIRTLQRPYKYHTLLIYRGYEILRPGSIEPLQSLKDQVVPFILCLDQEHAASQLYRYLKLLRLIIDIDQQHIIQDQILDKAILIHLLLIGEEQILKLADPHPPRHLYLRAAAFQHKAITWILVIFYKEYPHILLDLEPDLIRRYICQCPAK